MRRTASAFSGEPTEVITFAPNAFANWIAASPSPLAPACTKTVSPSLICASRKRFRYAVANTSGSEAASAIDNPAGTGRTIPSGTAIFSAYPPPPSNAHTSSPAFQRLPAGAERTTPATSSPIHSGHPGGGGYFPARWSRSARFSAAARIFSRTSPSFGTGSGTSVQCIACASSTFIAYMTYSS